MLDNVAPGLKFQGVIAKEEHFDSGIHYHVYAKSNRKLDIRNPSYFDVLHKDEDG